MLITRVEIETAFKEWLAEEIPVEIFGYDDDHARIFGKVFVIIAESTVIGTVDTKTEKEFVFPLARVYQVGTKWEGCKCVVGDVVRLKDYDAKTQYNPRYEVSINNPYSKAVTTSEEGMKMVNPLPPKEMQNLWGVMGQKMFNPDPFDYMGEGWLSDVFYFDSASVVCRVRDYRKFLKGK